MLPSQRSFLFIGIQLFLCHIGSVFNQNPLDLSITSVEPFRKLVEENGFKLEEHHYVTEDRYNLVLHRIVPPNYNSSTYNIGRKPVILVHGILGSSNNFFLNGETGANFTDGECGNNFGFCLVNSQRYDVWAMNNRGNGYSYGRTNPPLISNYWAFSFDQMAIYDLPATIDYVQNTTGAAKVAVVGHSQGTSIMFALLTSDYGTKYHNVIEPAIAWGPVVYFYDMTSKIVLLGPAKYLLMIPVELTTTSIGNWFVQLFCEFFPFGGSFICPEFVIQIYGATSSIDFDTLPRWLNYVPSPSSTWSMLHLTQLYSSRNFQHFDYGSALLNIIHYKQPIPPLYDIKSFPSQVHLQIYNGVTDALIPMANAVRLQNDVDPEHDNSELVQVAYNCTWNHIDYLFSSKAGLLVYKPTLDYLDAHP